MMMIILVTMFVLLFLLKANSRREDELAYMQEETQELQARFQEILNQTRADRDLKTQECEELRMQV